MGTIHDQPGMNAGPMMNFVTFAFCSTCLGNATVKLALPHSMPDELRRLVSLVGVSGLATVAVVAFIMLMGRAVAPAASVSPWLLLGLGMLAVTCLVALRELATLRFEANDSRRTMLAPLATVGMLLSVAALAVPPTSPVVVSVLGVVIVAEELAYWWLLARDLELSWAWLPRASSGTSDSPARPARSQSLAGSLAHDLLSSEEEELESEQLLPPEVLQQLTRSRSESGGEVIYGLLRVEFTAGERQQWLSVAFCPPLQSRPGCTAHFAEGAEGVLKVEEVESYGVRLMVRLPQAVVEQQSLLVEMFAETTATLKQK